MLTGIQGQQGSLSQAESTYHYPWNPSEWEQTQEDEFHDRFGNGKLQDHPYGVRDDIAVPPELAQDCNGNDHDDAYFGDWGKYTTPRRRRTCICCVHNEEQSFAYRLQDYTETYHHHMRKHMVNNLSIALAILRQGADASRLQTCFVNNNALCCPDVVCKSQPRTFSSPLELVWHLSAVHMIDWTSGDTVYKRTFSSEGELRFFLSTAHTGTSMESAKAEFKRQEEFADDMDVDVSGPAVVFTNDLEIIDSDVVLL